MVDLLGGAEVGLIAAFPKELVLAVAGLALLGTIGSGLAVAMKEEGQREAAPITFVVTADGLRLWGVVAGAVVLGAQRAGRWSGPGFRCRPLRTATYATWLSDAAFGSVADR